MALCLAFGAGGMFLASNFRLRLEPVSDPVAIAAPPAPKPVEPGVLPGVLTARPGSQVSADGAVVPAGAAGAPAAGAPAAGAPATGATTLLRVERVKDGEFNWNTQTPGDVYLSTSTPQLVLSEPLTEAQAAALKVKLNGVEDAAAAFKIEPKGNRALVVGQAALATLSDTQPLRVTLLLDGRESAPVTLRLPKRDAAPAGGLAVEKFANSPHRDPVPLASPKAVYVGETGGSYLRLQGTNTRNTTARVVLQVGDGDAYLATPVKSLPDSTGLRWDYELNLGDLDVKPLKVRVLAEAASGGHAYASGAAEQFAAEIPPPAIPTPTVTPRVTSGGKVLAEATDLPGGAIKTYRTNARKLDEVVVAAPAEAKAVVLFVNNRRVGELAVTAAGDKTFQNVDLTGADEFGIRAIAVVGRAASRDGLAVVKVRETGPSVEGVFAPGFGATGGEGKVFVKFSSRSLLVPGPANKVSNYEVKNEANDNVLTPSSAVYDPAADTVVLTVPGVTHASYMVSVKNSDTAADKLKDLYGNLVAAADGAPNKIFFQARIYAAAPDQLGSPTAGVPLQTGPPVTFPEYTRFRQVPDGFNPSDRVETRVARLYYYRDAHRVAMIVNRTVKSYSGAEVDVRRRAADRARTDADGATDERKRLQDQAVKSAQDARGAENQLQELQQKQATAKVESANARVLLPQREFELQQATQNLGRNTTLTADVVATDETVRARQQALNLADADLALAKSRALQFAALPGPQKDAADAAQVQSQFLRNNAQADYDRAVTEARLRADAVADPNRANVARLTTEVATLRQVVAAADANAAAAANEIAAAQQRVTALRETEFQRTVAWQEQELRERRARETEFRRDVAAAAADPNTYAPGDPNSDDPVMQVSVSVIGEGLIQLRGPIKGINVIRIMINQIDAPVGQVRVAMHTVQVNGERGDRMEKVVANIQRYLDHSRFLTTQSSQMLRRAVGVVASRKAEEAALTLAPGCTQADRDQRYLYSFFGKEFTDELALLDSEFLKTGNKLLSLHSMDTTSLASALFVLSLARNDVRLEITHEFARLLQTELPEMENTYYLAGLSGNGHKCEACCDRRVYMLSQNARFVSFGGFFNAQGAAADTMTPLQREFVRLAQVFKARMITELQLKQRVTERAMVEERFAIPYQQQRKQAIDAEIEAKQKLGQVQDKLQDATAAATAGLASVQSEVDRIRVRVADTDAFVKALQDSLGKGEHEANDPRKQVRLPSGAVRMLPKVETTTKNNVRTSIIKLDTDERGPQVMGDLEDLKHLVELFFYPDVFYKSYVEPLKETIDTVLSKKTLDTATTQRIIELTHPVLEKIRSAATSAQGQVQVILGHLTRQEPEPSKAASEFAAFEADINEKLYKGRDLANSSQRIFDVVRPQFRQLVAVSANYEAALRKSRTARRPIDEKKLLDLLVDELEDKFIEQLEGTRAHTANIDNYIKALSTALDDDFQTQFYNPSFRRVREATARFWDVTLGQVETTTVLVNNRGLALVRPSATFEFDLPKRDIMITEGFKSAKALVDDYGALVNDPSFLALAKLYSGNPVTTQQNTGGSLASVRNVLPGLPVTADEMVMAQAGPGRREFGSALEGLIPDPAIYKFETGTGFEIRPTLSPDGQNVVFKLNYMYTTDVREPVRADEKHLGRVKRHFVDTDVQLSNYELREVSTYRVALRASRTGKGVPGLQDIPGVGVLFRPLPSSESSLQQNLIYSQATIFPTLFDLMGLRYAPAVADLDPLADRLAEFAARNRHLDILQRTADLGATRVDDALRTPNGERRTDLYRPVVTIPAVHPNGYSGPGLRLRDGTLIEGPPAPPGFDPRFARPQTPFAPGTTPESAPRPILLQPTGPIGFTPPGATVAPGVAPTAPALPGSTGVLETLRTPARPSFGPGAATGTAPPAGAGLGTVIQQGGRPSLPGTPTAVPPPFPAPVGLPAPTPLPPSYPTALPAPVGTPFPLPR